MDKVKFTHKEWTGIDYKDADSKAVTGETFSESTVRMRPFKTMQKPKSLWARMAL